MTSEIYWLYNFNSDSRIGIMARPRGGDWLDGEIRNLNKEKVSVLVSLLEPAEERELDLTREGDVFKLNGLNFINFPIPDRGIPASKKNTEKLLLNLSEALTAGQTVVIHCRMGIGRSSIIAGAILLKNGFGMDDLLAHISKARRLKVPDTQEQIDWLKSR